MTILCELSDQLASLVSRTATRMVAVDRFGCDYQVTVAGGRGDLAVRVPFAAPLSGLDDARRALVAQTYAARDAWARGSDARARP